MTDDRKSGIALIVGSLGLLLTMAIHPGGVSSLTAEQAQHLSIVSGAAHSVAIVSILLLFLGACGLTRSIAAADRMSFAAIVTYGFATVAVMIAAAVSGFIFPSILKDMLFRRSLRRASVANRARWRFSDQSSLRPHLFRGRLARDNSLVRLRLAE
jgi:hypothetical protein